MVRPVQSNTSVARSALQNFQIRPGLSGAFGSSLEGSRIPGVKILLYRLGKAKPLPLCASYHRPGAGTRRESRGPAASPAGPQGPRNMDPGHTQSTQDEQTHTGPKRRDDSAKPRKAHQATTDSTGVFSRLPRARWGPIGCSFELSLARERTHALRVSSRFK